MILSLVASLSVPLPEQIDDDDLVDIQWMPPGKQLCQANNLAGKPEKVMVTVDENGANRVAKCFEEFKAKAAEGTGDAPFIDFDHENKAAAGWVQKVYWGGDDPLKGGIRIKAKLSDPGTAAIKGKSYRRFSPGFQTTKTSDGTNQVYATFVNMGGLVNRAGFQTIQSFFAQFASDEGEHETNQKTDNNMTDEEVTALKAKNAALEEQIQQLQKQLSDINESQAQNAVNEAVKNGQLDPDDKELQAKWTTLVKQNPDNMYLLAKLPGKAVPGQVYSTKDNKDEPDEGKALLAKYNDISDPTKRYEFFSEHQEKLCKAAIQ